MPALRGIAREVRGSRGEGGARRVGVRPLVRAAIVGLALLALGEAAPGAFPLRASIEALPGTLEVSLDGTTHVVALPPTLRWTHTAFESPGPELREYQLDGTDLTFTLDRDPEALARIRETPLYSVVAWLRDEARYSRWEHARLIAEGREVAVGPSAVAAASLPPSFRLEAGLTRPEAPARLWLHATDGTRLALEVDRERRRARLRVNPGVGGNTLLGEWYLPEQAAPFVASHLHLVGRSAAAGIALVLAALAASLAAQRLLPSVTAVPRWPGRPAVVALLAIWLLSAAWVAGVVLRQAPHVLDAVAYHFQAGVLASGRTWLAAPPEALALRGPFQVMHEGRWFAQYAPGAPAAYAVGSKLGVAWLVGPIAGAAMLAGIYAATGRLFGRGTAAIALLLGAASPFILFQAGSFLAHVLAAAPLAWALAIVAHRGPLPRRASLVAGALLAAAFVVREPSAALFGLTLAAWLVSSGRRRAVPWLVLGGLPFLLAYLAYNAALTGHPLLPPRALFDSADRFGFGDGVGFYGRHTPAAGLVVVEALLTLLQMDLLGWPPPVALGLLGLPFALGHADRRDAWLAGGALLFAAVHAGYYAHGVAFGPRYFFEALPFLLPLAARGLAATAAAVGALVGDGRTARLGVGLAVLPLVLYAAGFYLPRQVERRAAYTGIPYNRRLEVPFVSLSPAGPRLSAPPGLVITDDWWLHNMVLSPLNCPDLDARAITGCPTLFAYVRTSEDEARLTAAYPQRAVYRAVDEGGVLALRPRG